MGRKLKRLVLALCVLALCMSAMGGAVFAASTVTVNIPVHITLSGTEPAVPETFVVEVTAADPGYPMPTGADNGVYTMKMEGKSSKTIDMEFYGLGIYDYTVKLEAGTNDDCSYDDAVYNVTVFVTNSETGAGYDRSVVVCRNQESSKREDILFENVYTNEPETEPPQTGDYFQVFMWLTLLALSVTGIVVLAVLSRKGKNP